MTKGVFDSTVLKWKGREYTLPGHRTMGAIMRVEDILTLTELQKFSERETMPLGKMAAAYATVLRYVGAQVTDEEVYETLFEGAADDQQAVLNGITGLLTMMLPRKAVEKATAAVAARTNGGAEPNGAGKPEAQVQPTQTAAVDLSPTPSRPPLARGE